MKIIIAIDSFKGCLSSIEANMAAAEGIRNVCPEAEIVQVPVSDGGEGFLEAFCAAIGGETVEIPVRDPMMRPITAEYLMQGETAVVEIARASGLPLLTAEERNPLVATSYGTGQLVADAVRRGAKHVLVGLGGSATSDAGKGMLRALKDAFAKNGTWDDIEELKSVRFTIASDVRNPLYGENGAAHVFAPQNAFLEYLNAECKSGIQILLDTIHFREQAKDADLVITGEGSADCQTLMGKLPMGVLEHAEDAPVALMAGRISDRDTLLHAGFAWVECINPPDISLEEAMRKEVAQHNISLTARRILLQRQRCSFRG